MAGARNRSNGGIWDLYMDDEKKHKTVCLVLSQENRSWIIEKFAHRLAENLPEFGFQPVISYRPSPSADINHWMSYAFANESVSTLSSMFITHIDDPYKLALVRNELRDFVDMGICMSNQSRLDLCRAGVPPVKLAFVLPAHDADIAPRRITIGLTTRVYPDGRKREALLARLADDIPLDAFRFEIYGSGWEAVVPRLRAGGATVDYFPGTADYVADYAQMKDALRYFDYYLYLGLDEGSMGTLDALAAGVRTIVTPQGFHLDLANGITHEVTDYADVNRVFSALSRDWRERVDSVSSLTWRNYARRHSLIWGAMLSGEPPDATLEPPVQELSRPRGGAASRLAFELRRFAPLRIRSAISHLPALRGVRRLVRGVIRNRPRA